MNPPFIDTPAALQAFSEEIGTAHWLGLDTEFIREKTYWPQLCLLQVSSPEALVLIDLLRITDLSPLYTQLASPTCRIILHAPDQDLEALYHAGFPPLQALFDTQHAAALLGHPDQLGYAALVDTLLGITLDKGQQRTDWSRRPLKTAQLAYAADDVRYLHELQAQLSEQLQAKGRLAWLEEDCQRMAEPQRYQVNIELAWQRLRGIGRLPAQEQPIAAALARWREQRALDSNRPRRWILADDALYQLARKRPTTVAQLGECSLPPALQRQHAQALLDICAGGNACAAQIPALPDKAQRKQLEQMKTAVAKVAEAEQLSSSVLATRAELEALLRGDQPARLLHGWRHAVIGETLLAMC